jgi:hypothetical protein
VMQPVPPAPAYALGLAYCTCPRACRPTSEVREMAARALRPTSGPLVPPEPFSTLAPLIGAPLPVRSAAGGPASRTEPYACPADIQLAPLTGFSYTYRPIPEFLISATHPDAVGLVSRLYWGPPHLNVFACVAGHHPARGGGTPNGMESVNLLLIDGTARRGPGS